ncbi:Phospholipase D4 [Triplophysa tibetana]|uniref:Phospholipase D4 n=1 Tax=Triplophysa tibetana TaxID=1572043 RepID=A0A5A9NRY6_9TELE|nr:Phospholipase D4 [Triplophysa tibetana]
MSQTFLLMSDEQHTDEGSQCPTAALAASGCLIVLGVLLAIAVIERLKNEDEINTALNPHHTATFFNQSVHDEQSRIVLVESIPLDVDYGMNASFGKSLYEEWKNLLSVARDQIDVASFYWSLTGEDINVNSSTDASGRDILEKFKALPSRNVSVRIVTSVPSLALNSTDLKLLQENGIEIRRVNFGRLTKGILHTKFWIVDRRHIYIGSANMDWRALTQVKMIKGDVKELGVVIYNSSALASDLHKVFQSYWVMGRSNASIPEPWPSSYDTLINEEHPLVASPPAFCPDSRTPDLHAILSAIRDAREFIHVSVMEYYPASKFAHRHGYWPVIENALKHSAFEKNISVRLLFSCGLDTDPSVLPFLRSLDALRSPSDGLNIQVMLFGVFDWQKLYVIPVGNRSHIPYAKVNHNKYMVTDKVAYIGTSNWSADYFNTTAGVGLVVSQDALRGNPFQKQLSLVFHRDWNSQFAIPLAELNQNHDCVFSKSTG